MSPRNASTSAPVLEHIATRWSPRAFDHTHSLPEGALRGVFEAARWAPSANNTQPWRFIVTRRGSESFAKVEATLLDFNKQWAGSAAALVVNIAEIADAAGSPIGYASYDLGQAVANYTLQARAEGLYVHQMGGFDREAISAAFDLDPRFAPISVAAIGELGDADRLPDVLQQREAAPRERLPLDDLLIVND